MNGEVCSRCGEVWRGVARCGAVRVSYHGVVVQRRGPPNPNPDPVLPEAWRYSRTGGTRATERSLGSMVRCTRRGWMSAYLSVYLSNCRSVGLSACRVSCTPHLAQCHTQRLRERGAWIRVRGWFDIIPTVLVPYSTVRLGKPNFDILRSNWMDSRVGI